MKTLTLLLALLLSPALGRAASSFTGMPANNANSLLGSTANTSILGMSLDAAAGANTYTLVQVVGDIDEDSALGTMAVTVTATGAGHLLVAWNKWESTVNLSSVSDGTSSFTLGTQVNHANGDFHGAWAYLLSSNAGATTITATYSGSTGWRRLIVFEFSCSGTPAFDTQNTGSGSSGGTGSIASGSITTAGSGVVLGGYGAYSSGTISSPLIAGNAATFDRGGTINETCAWYYLATGTVSGTAAVTMSGAHPWIVNAIAFK